MFKEALLYTALALGSGLVFTACDFQPQEDKLVTQQEKLERNDRLVCYVDGVVTYQADGNEIVLSEKAASYWFVDEQINYFPKEGETCKIIQAQ